eukprot:scaffold32022_cov62-Phaeocystis_antarctica.AAC.4
MAVKAAQLSGSLWSGAHAPVCWWKTKSDAGMRIAIQKTTVSATRESAPALPLLFTFVRRPRAAAAPRWSQSCSSDGAATAVASDGAATAVGFATVPRAVGTTMPWKLEGSTSICTSLSATADSRSCRIGSSQRLASPFGLPRAVGTILPFIVPMRAVGTTLPSKPGDPRTSLSDTTLPRKLGGS